MTATENGTGSQTDAWRQATRLVRGGTQRSEFGETCEGLFLTSGYVYDNAEQAEARFKGEVGGFIYSRFSNPTVSMLEERMALLEGAEAARATASGMAAVNASILAQVRAGDHVVGAKALFGSCRYILDEILPRFGVEVTLVDGTDLDQWEAAMRKDTVCAFLETPSNPGLEIIDLERVTEIVHSVGARLIVDNVFATPLLQQPLTYGADIVVYSATKHIDGQGRTMGGVVLSDQAFCDEYLTPFLRHTGPAMSPFNAWILLKGLETLPLRVTHHCKQALEVANFLHNQHGLERVLYPGLPSHPQHTLAQTQMSGNGSIVAFDIVGGKESAFRFLNALKLIDISNNLGDSKSLITHPATTTHQRLAPEERAELGISDSMVRLSVGLEDVEDIKEDIAQALASA